MFPPCSQRAAEQIPTARRGGLATASGRLSGGTHLQPSAAEAAIDQGGGAQAGEEASMAESVKGAADASGDSALTGAPPAASAARARVAYGVPHARPCCSHGLGQKRRSAPAAAAKHTTDGMSGPL